MEFFVLLEDDKMKRIVGVIKHSVRDKKWEMRWFRFSGKVMRFEDVKFLIVDIFGTSKKHG